MSDEDNHKVTAVSLLGLQGAKDMVASYDETIRKELGINIWNFFEKRGILIIAKTSL